MSVSIKLTKSAKHTGYLFYTHRSKQVNVGYSCLSYERPKANSYPVSTLSAPSVSPQASPISALPGEDHNSKTLIRPLWLINCSATVGHLQRLMEGRCRSCPSSVIHLICALYATICAIKMYK